MPTNLIPFIYTGIFAVVVIAVIPRNEIHRLSIYAIIFGGMFDVIVVTVANLLGAFKYINYGALGFMGIHILAPTAWTLFFILYFYFLPYKRTAYLYIYVTGAIIYSIAFCQMLYKLNILFLAHGLIDSIIPFVIWFPLAIWGYLKLKKKDYEHTNHGQL